MIERVAKTAEVVGTGVPTAGQLLGLLSRVPREARVSVGTRGRSWVYTARWEETPAGSSSGHVTSWDHPGPYGSGTQFGDH